MRAAGMSPINILFPLFCGGVFLASIIYLLNEYVVPKASHKVHYISEVLIEGQTENKIDKESRWFREKQTILNFKEFTDGQLRN